MKNKYFDAKDSMIQMMNSQKVLAMLNLMNKYFWKTKIAPILSLVMPFIFMLIFYLAGDLVGRDPAPVDGIEAKPSTSFIEQLPSFISMTVLPLLLLTLPQMNVDMRNSILLRKIKISEINKSCYLFWVSFYFAMMSFVFMLFNFFIFLIFASQRDEVKYLWIIDWGGLFYGLIVMIVSTIAIALFISILTSKPLNALLSGFGIYLLSVSFAGQFIPIFVIANIEALPIITLFSPINYSLSLLNNAVIPFANYELKEIVTPDGINLMTSFTGFEKNSIFDLTTPFAINNMFNPFSFPTSEGGTFSVNSIVIYHTWQKGLNYFVPWIILVGFSTLNLKKFKWTSR